MGYDTLSNQEVSNETLDDQARGENLAALVSALPLDGVRKMLDVGCGTGALTLALARALGPEAEVVGVDVTADHIAHARKAAATAGVDTVRFLQADILAEDSGLPGDFDLAVEKYLLMYQVPLLREGLFLKRMRDLVKPGGRVALFEADIDFGGERYPPPPEPLASLLPRVVEVYRRTGRIEWRCGIQLFHHMRAAGFHPIEVTLVDGRIVAGGRPRALVEHGCREVEELLAPCVEEMGLSDAEAKRAARQWRDYLRDPGTFLYTPIFLGLGTVDPEGANP